MRVPPGQNQSSIQRTSNQAANAQAVNAEAPNATNAVSSPKRPAGHSLFLGSNPLGWPQDAARGAMDAASKYIPKAVDAAKQVLDRVKPIKLNVPWISQYHKGHGFNPGHAACFDAAKAIASKGGATVMGSNKRIQIATGEDRKGRIKVDKAKAKEGVDYINKELQAGRPVMVGVSHQDSNINRDKITDHFVVITGRNVDKNGKMNYTFHDPATANPEHGKHTRPLNRFHVDDKTGKLTRDGDPNAKYVKDAPYDVSMVRINRESIKKT